MESIEEQQPETMTGGLCFLDCFNDNNGNIKIKLNMILVPYE